MRLKKLVINININIIILICLINLSYGQSKDKLNSYDWDFNDIYSTWEKWEGDIQNSIEITNDIVKYKGKLNVSSDNLLSFLKLQDKLSISLTKQYVYVIMHQDLDNKNPEYNNYFQKLMNHYSFIEDKLVWTEQEILSITKKRIEQWMNKNPELLTYKHYLFKLYKQQENILPEDKQELVNKYSKVFMGSKNTYNSLLKSDREFEIISINGKETKISPVNLENILTYNQSQLEREKAYDAYIKYFQDHKNTFASIYKNILETRWAEAQIYGYSSCLESFLAPNNIPVNVYTNLMEAAKNNTEPLKKYHQIRKEYLKLTDYNAWDNTIVLFDTDNKKYEYNEAKTIVKQATSILGDEYVNNLSKSLENNWIDVFEKDGKRAGAYSINVYSVHPYILMNFGGTRRNLFTLAHELGHSVHTQFSNEYQAYTNHNYPIFLAEIASILNEHLLLDYLIENANSSEEKISFIIQGIQNLERKFFTQTIRAEFEYKTHQMIEQGKPMNAEILGDLYNEISNSYYGETFTKKEGHKYSWVAVHHLFIKDFYVYQYATSYAASLYFFDKIKYAENNEKRNAAINNYLTLLKSGGKDYPIKLLKEASLDMTTTQPYEPVIKRLESLVNQLESELIQYQQNIKF